MKIKIPVLIVTTVNHTDNAKIYCPQQIASKEWSVEIEVEADDKAIEVFRALWTKNTLDVTVSGRKTFHDGEEIA